MTCLGSSKNWGNSEATYSTMEDKCPENFVVMSNPGISKCNENFHQNHQQDKYNPKYLLGQGNFFMLNSLWSEILG